MSFSSIGLSDPIMRSISASGYSKPTEIQAQAIPIVLCGKDLIGCAPTGTGKTAAFVLPMLHRLEQAKPAGRTGVRALVLTPTRELAIQVDQSVKTYGRQSTIRSLAVYGGVDIMRQVGDLRQGPDILIATPGRLIDLLERRLVSLSQVAILVLDEADRMLDMGFIYDVRRIIGQTPPVRQTLLFSATMSQEVCSLAATIQKKPEYVAVAGSTAPAKTVAQTFISVPRQSKTDLLVHILKNEEVETMLVFSRTKHGADKIARKLCNCGITTAAIHSNRSMAQRARALDGFKKRQYRVLVATDLAARGIDVANISHVVNYDTPAFAEDYIHRIGRTGRAENAGTAFTFVSSEEEQYKTKIERMIGKRFDLKRYPGFKGDGHRHSPQPVRVSFSGHAVVAAAPAQKKAGWFRKITGRSAMN